MAALSSILSKLGKSEGKIANELKIAASAFKKEGFKEADLIGNLEGKTVAQKAESLLKDYKSFNPKSLSEDEISLLPHDSDAGRYLFRKTIGDTRSEVAAATEGAANSELKLGDAIWTNQGQDRNIKITGEAGMKDGRRYVNVEGSNTGIPYDEIHYPGGDAVDQAVKNAEVDAATKAAEKDSSGSTAEDFHKKVEQKAQEQAAGGTGATAGAGDTGGAGAGSTGAGDTGGSTETKNETKTNKKDFTSEANARAMKYNKGMIGPNGYIDKKIAPEYDVMKKFAGDAETSDEDLAKVHSRLAGSGVMKEGTTAEQFAKMNPEERLKLVESWKDWRTTSPQFGDYIGYHKVPQKTAAVAATAWLVSRMNDSKGHMSNSQLYGQSSPYGG
jgi:hypothetical protein